VLKNIKNKNYKEIIEVNNCIVGGGPKKKPIDEIVDESVKDITALIQNKDDHLDKLIKYIDSLYIVSYIAELPKVNNSLTEVIKKLDADLKDV
jgi:hypothetical protein